MSDAAIENLYREGRTFPPPHEFVTNALVKDAGIYRQAEADPEAWWASHAEQLRWLKPWDTVCEWDPPHAKWFVGGQLNVSDNCLDRHIEDGHGEQVAYYWEGEPGDTRELTYGELRDEVCRF